MFAALSGSIFDTAFSKRFKEVIYCLNEKGNVNTFDEMWTGSLCKNAI